MWKPRQARRLPVFSALIAGSALLAKVSGRCAWEFGNMNNGRSFGGARQYGKVGPGTMGAFAGRVRTQPSC